MLICVVKCNMVRTVKCPMFGMCFRGFHLPLKLTIFVFFYYYNSKKYVRFFPAVLHYVYQKGSSSFKWHFFFFFSIKKIYLISFNKNSELNFIILMCLQLFFKHIILFKVPYLPIIVPKVKMGYVVGNVSKKY